MSSGKAFLNTRVFGLLPGDSWWVIIIVLIILGYLLRLWIFEKFPFFLGLIIAGGISNIIDRIIFGGVIDYVQIASFFFNAADIFVWVGCVALVIEFVRRRRCKIPISNF